MDHQILEFIGVCRDLGSEKKKDRSNAAAKLKNFLNHAGVKKALDKNFEQKQTSKSSAKIFTWENVFKAACLYLKMETEEIKHARDNVSQATLTRRESKTQEAVSLMKSVIRTADRGGPKLKGVSVFTYIAESLKDEYMCSAYGQDFCSILLRNILSVRKYVVELTTQQWHDMLSLIFKLFNDPDIKLDQLLLARVIYTLICGITAQCDVRPKKILSFFCGFFINVKKYTSPSMINQMMMGMNVFVKAIAPSSRLQVCKLGEDTMPYVLYLWHSMADQLKDSIVEFIQLQMWCHHPAGVKNGSVAAFAADWDKWMSSLRKLYEVLYNEIQQIGNRNRPKENRLKEGVIDLAVDVCQQLFSESSHAIEVTQMSCDSGDSVSRPGTKKRRLESGWTAIRDFISSAGQTVKLIPWLQLVTRMLEKYQSSLPSDEVVPYLQCIANVLSDCKRSDLISPILKCCEAFGCSWPVFRRNMSSDQKELCKQIWSRIWADTLRYVSLHHSESRGYQLLSAILMQDLIIPGRDIWSIFVPIIRMPVTDSVKFLATFLISCDLPEKHREKLITIESRNEVVYPLRKQLIDWLLPTREGNEEGTKVRYKTDPDWTAQVLLMLMLRNPASMQGTQTVSGKPHLSDLETWSLKSAFELPLKVEKVISCHANKADTQSVVHIPGLMNEIENIFHRDVQVFCRGKENEVSDIEDMVDYAAILLKIISYLLRFKILSSTTLSHSNTFEQFLKIMKKLTTSTHDLVKKTGSSGIQSIIVKLQQLFKWKEENKVLNCIVGVVCRSVTPSRLIDILMDICKEKNLRPCNEQDSNHLRDRGSHLGRARVLDDFDDPDGDPLDIEFEDHSVRNNNLDIEMEFEDSQDSDDSRAAAEVFTSLLCPAVVTETQRFRLDAVQTLCNWCSYCQEVSSNQLKSEVDVKYIRSKLIKLLTENSFDAGRPVDIQMMILIVNSMTETTCLSDSEKTAILDAIRNLVKLHRKDQQICRTGLEMMIKLLPHLQDSGGMVTPALLECRDSFLQLVNVFWKLQEDNNFSSEVRQCLVTLLDKIIEIDPRCEWSRFPCENDSDSQEEGPLPVSRLVECMGDYCHMVRMQGSAVTYRLFVYGEGINLHHFDRTQQERAFEQLYDILCDSLDVQGRLSDDRLQDETNNRIASVLTSLATVICTSTVCEKKAVFTCLKIMKEKHVALEKIQHMFQKVSTTLGYRCAEKFVGSHLAYIIHKWLNVECKIQEFPYQLLACETLEQFYRRYSNVLIPELVNKRDMESVKLVCERLDCDVTSMIKDCLPSVVVHMLPLFAASKLDEYKHDEQICRRTAKATSSYNVLVQQLSEKVTESEIVNNLDTIVINILCCLHDGDAQNDDINNILPEPNPPSYDTHLITATLEYLTKSFSGSGKSLIEILARSSDSIQKILLHLALLMSSSHRQIEKRRVLQIYQLFTRLLLKSFHTQLGGAWVYVLRELIVRLVHLLQDSMDVSGGSSCIKDSILLTTCQLLQDVCSVSVNTCVEEFKKYLPVITSNLIPLAKGSGEVGQKFLSLLRFLILEKAKVLQSAIVILDEFPDDPILKDCKDLHQRLKYVDGTLSLKQEIEHFLNTSHNYYVSPEFRMDGLKFLQDKLAADSESLLQLTKDGTISRLMCELNRLTKCANKDVAMEAGKCLGLIGPVNLYTISLSPQNGNPGLDLALSTFQDTPEVLKYCKIFHCLNNYLTDKSMDLVLCTSDVLKVIMSTKTGVEFCTGYKARLGDSEFLFCYLHPFRPSKKKTVLRDCKPEWQAFVSSVDQETLWNPHHLNHESWVITLTTTLISSGAVRDEILRSLSPVCLMKSKFCEMILPYLIHDILRSGNEDHAELLSRQVDNFFTCHCSQSSPLVNRCQSVTSVSVPAGDEYICMNVDSIRTMIDVIQYLRQQQRPKVGRKEMTAWDNNFWLDIDYLQVAMAAQYCSSHFSTILYAEIWCDVQREKGIERGSRGSQKSYSQSLSQETRIDTLSDTSSCHSVSIQDLLLVAYKWIGDPDGVYGCGAGRKADMSSRICTYQQENKWDKALISCDIQMNQSATSAEYDLLHALQNFGTSHIFSTYLQGIVGREDMLDMTLDIRELQYEAAWKIGQWDLDTSIKLSDKTGYHESVYKALRAVRETDFVSGTSALQHARLCSIACLKDNCVDSAKRLYPVLASLQCISIIEDASSCLQSVNGFTDRQWDSVTRYDNDFDFILPILYTRCSSLNIIYEKTKDKEIFNLYVNSLLGLSTMARESRRHQICERAVNSLKMLEITDLQQSLSVQIEEARLYWCREEQNVAKYLMRTIIDKVKKLKSEDRVAAKYYPQVLSIYGNWLAETRSENPNIIMENYLEKTVELFEQLGEDLDLSMDAYLSLGRYADSQYQNIVSYMKSSTYEAKLSLMEKAKLEAEGLREIMGEQAKDRYLRTLEKQGEIDKNESICLEEDKIRFLLTAVQNYLHCLRCGDAHNLRIFRLTSLWFSNGDSEEVNQLIEAGIGDIPTYKWIPLMYQLAARMDVRSQQNASLQFLAILDNVIQKTAVDHPHHTLFCILALANANRDTELMQQARASKRTGKMSTKSQSEKEKEEGRVEAAKNMIKRLLQDDRVAEIVKELQRLCDAYIQLANWNVSQHKTETKPIQLPSALWISKVVDLQNVPVPTREIQVDKSGKYENISYIHNFQPTFKLAGGINLPKIISCVGSDGRSSRQLVKGKDDLRQDAIMQQVFDMVNNLLQKNNETRKRCLQIRKYKVIPLSQTSGLLEWCEGTQPIGEYLIGSAHSAVKGAHERYRPQDWSAYQCRKHLTEGRSKEEKLKAYLEICIKFQPVFRHFLMEKFSEPSVWLERRLSYTRSVATNSIVGYILGLGDRHVQNILIDCHSAELVHIDLGVAFEQGEILPTPETVPFRLTRDIEDAMGSSGVEGVFRRCCEKTMEVMRNNQEALLTILEVLLHDPLHAWTISPAKAYTLQQRLDKNIHQDTLDITNTTGDFTDMAETTSFSASVQEKNKLAERVLLCLREKLQGIEDGVQLSLQGQVNHLIQEARNPKNLARLFPGWQPYI